MPPLAWVRRYRYGADDVPHTTLKIIQHIDGNHRNHEVKNLRPGTLPPKCQDCSCIISEDRVRWFAKHLPGVTPATCASCSFARKVNRTPHAA